MQSNSIAGDTLRCTVFVQSFDAVPCPIRWLVRLWLFRCWMTQAATSPCHTPGSEAQCTEAAVELSGDSHAHCNFVISVWSLANWTDKPASQLPQGLNESSRALSLHLCTNRAELSPDASSPLVCWSLLPSLGEETWEFGLSHLSHPRRWSFKVFTVLPLRFLHGTSVHTSACPSTFSEVHPCLPWALGCPYQFLALNLCWMISILPKVGEDGLRVHGNRPLHGMNKALSNHGAVSPWRFPLGSRCPIAAIVSSSCLLSYLFVPFGALPWGPPL